MNPRWAAAGALIGMLSGCEGSPPPQPLKPAAVTQAAPPAQPPAPAAAPFKEPESSPPPLPPKVYEAGGRRDPFRPLIATEGTKGLTVTSAKLVGIVQGRQGPLALIETTDGLGYIVKTGDVIGDGRVVEIGRDNVTFAVAARPGQAPSRVTLQLRTE